MQENNKLWLEVKEMFETSQTEVTIFNGAGSDSAKICDMLRVTSASAMGAVMLNTSGVVFDDWIRLYGGDTSDRVGISKINLLSKNGTPERVKQMLIVATDVVGGIFAINSGKFDEGIGELSYKEDWTPEQRAEADAKCKALSDADTVKTKVERNDSPSVEYKKAFGKDSIPAGKDIDHTIDLQLGGNPDVKVNGKPLDKSVNRSLGKQIGYLIKDFDYGTIIRKFTMVNRQ